MEVEDEQIQVDYTLPKLRSFCITWTQLFRLS